MKFRSLELDQNLLKALDEMGFEDCTEVQEKTFQYTLKNYDVCVQSQTGTGKTGAFLISIFQKFTQSPKQNLQALVITPTRELAEQVYQESLKIGKYLPFQSVAVYGGTSIEKQIKLLKEKPGFIIGTPGRILDLASQKMLQLNDIEIAVFDEADRMFDMGFYPDIQKIFRKMKNPTERNTYLFSATLGLKSQQLAWQFMNEPAEIVINPEQLTVEKINQALYHVGTKEKISLLIGILKSTKVKQCLVFTNTKLKAIESALRLRQNGFDAHYIIGDLSQHKRQQLIDKMKKGTLEVLVATDVAARGIHINDLPLVINYDLPMHKENYVHRIGRTARAGNDGKAITFVCENYVYGLEAIETYIEQKIDVDFADDDLFEDDKSEGLYFIPSKNKANGKLVTRTEFHNEKSLHRKEKKKHPRADSKHKKTPSNMPQKSERHAKKVQKEQAKKPEYKPIKITSDMDLKTRLEAYEKKYQTEFKMVEQYTLPPKETTKIITTIKTPTLIDKVLHFIGLR